VPLNGFESNGDAVEPSDGLVLRHMTDTQISDAIGHLAVPRRWGGAGVNAVRVFRLDQWALTRTRAYQVAVGHGGAQPPAPAAFPSLEEPAARLVMALRIVCGGSVVTTRAMFGQDGREFPLVLGTSAMGTRSTAPTMSGPRC
jgi:hypothetical protein